MYQFSIVIICKNEAGVISNTLKSLLDITDDIIVYDNGSTDGTQDMVKPFSVRLIEDKWEGFGKTKNKANTFAKYDWILSLDADEAIDDELKATLMNWKPENERIVYRLRFRNFLGNKPIRYGDWGNDTHIRLFSRKHVNWDEADVHESLQLPNDTNEITLKGFVLHHTWRDMNDYKEKMNRYALLGAQKYFKQGKKSSYLKRFFSPVVAFISSYILKLGFLDGKAGYQCAAMMAYYTKKKYQNLASLYVNMKNNYSTTLPNT